MSGKVNFIKILVVGLFLVSGIQVSASGITDSIGVETVSGTNFIRHQVESGEGWYSIARKYGISYSELRMANKEGGDGLKIGQVILIPAKAKLNDPRFQKNYIDSKAEGDNTVKKEVKVDELPDNSKKKKHKVASGETLFSISKKHSISVDQIKKWNGLSNNTIEIGQMLVVGTDNSPEISEPEITKKEVKDKVEPKVDIPLPTPKTEPIEKNIVDVKTTEKKDSTILIKTINPEKDKVEVIKSEKKYSFANGRQEVNEDGFASWIDAEEINPNKYYALHRSAPIGTIIKVTNTLNSNSVFVKVVGVLQETAENEGILIKISKASAERLKVNDKKFEANLVYGLAGK